ncbi:hypothetical protein K3N28_09585 [Glycomyces sp. TRM65418]|uniref:hypothetical protein n=1 Tax=Glycomyces sp. TRM65418 TaxID=2867006 RepID=UPI001CE6C590|nr:hypothetical protein [Glycomyces sp. TRM65418]MCC3763322.1 hypothetical protein [Glycomyces sp. TRM65418]QZD57319.1 hypothetical protein K3N28_09525 [Glycomyces sp. TRM65418]
MDTPATPTDRAFRTASAALWTAAAALAVAAIGKIARYGQFRQSASDACDAVVDLEPPGGWSDSSFPCEQFAPMGWILPYWFAITAYLVFAVLFAVAAVKAAKASPGTRAFATTTTVLATLLCVVPGVFGLGWTFAVATANEADRLVAQRIHDAVPGWFTAIEVLVLLVAFAAALTAVILLRRRPDRP